MFDVIIYAIPFFLLTMIGEWRLIRQRGGFTRGYTPWDTFASLSMGIGYMGFAGAAALVSVPIFVFFSHFAIFDPTGYWWMWPALILVEDFCYYLYHRTSHEVRLFWASHVNHHSSTHYNLSTALRQPWTSPLLSWIFWLPAILLGFPVELVLLQKGFNLLYQYWIHTEAIRRLGPLEWVLNTPSHHRVHHGRNLRYLDRNYGGIFIIWDRLFGTFEPERDDEPPEYGLIHNLNSYNPVVIAFHEWRDLARDIARSPHRALQYIFRPPGWTPDGRSSTVRQMKRTMKPPAATTRDP